MKKQEKNLACNEEYNYLIGRLFYSWNDKIRTVNVKRRLKKKEKRECVLMNYL